MRRAVRGFTAAERAHLERVAAFPGFREWGLVARSASVDVVGGRFMLPFPDSLDPMDMPFPRYGGTKAVAHANEGREALLLSQGRVREAEEVARETISFGLVLMDDGTWLIESLIGAVIVGVGRDQLMAVYRASGRNAQADAIQAALDSVRARIEERDVETQGLSGPTGALAVRGSLIRVVKDTTLIRSLRWEMVSYLRLAPCGNARELVFGPSAELQAALDQAGRDLVRHPGDRELFRFLRGSLDHVSFNGRITGLGPSLAYRAARVMGWLMGNRRVPACVGTLLMYAY
jgi:hypothetical protein